MKSVLIIAFQYPPLGGVGTKRMSKFSKYLARMGYTVDVITVPYTFAMSNSWQSDVEHPNIIIHRIPPGCPVTLVMKPFPRTPVWRFLDFLRSGCRFTLRHSIFDIDWAQRWGRHLLPYAQRLLEQKRIVNVLATGAPYSTNYWAVMLKRRCPWINLINDYRDLWNDDVLRRYLSPWHRRRSEAWEQVVLDESDWIVSTTPEQEAILKRRASNKSTNFLVVHNGFDPDDDIASVESPADGFALVYTGNISNRREIGLHRFLGAIRRLNMQNHELTDHIRLDLYGVVGAGDLAAMNDLIGRGQVRYMGIKSPREALEAVARGFMALLINADIYPWAGSSKLYEYIHMRKPVFAVTGPGFIDRVIRQYDLGVSVQPDDEQALQKHLISWFQVWKTNPSYRLNLTDELYEQFSYPRLVARLTQCFK